MKSIILLGLTMILTGCNITPTDNYTKPLEFDWAPDEVTWQMNIRNCRSQPQCNAADLFNRHGI